MYYAIDNGNLRRLKLPLHIDGKDVFTNDEAILNANGYYRLVTAPPPDEREDYYYVPTYELDGNVIRQSWEAVPDEGGDNNVPLTV